MTCLSRKQLRARGVATSGASSRPTRAFASHWLSLVAHAILLAAFVPSLALSQDAIKQNSDEQDGGKANAEQQTAKPEEGTAETAKPPAEPIGRFVELSSPIDDRARSAIKNAGIELVAAASAENRKAVLIVAIPSGTSQYSDVYDVFTELVDLHRDGVKTIAWVPKTVTGYNAMLVFACQEVVVQQDIEIGDFGRGEAIDSDQVEFIRRKANQLGFAKRPAAVAVAMADPQQSLVQVDVKPAEGNATERRLVLETELKQMQESGVPILGVKQVSAAGTPLTLSDKECREYGIVTTGNSGSIEQLVADENLPNTVLKASVSADAPTKVRKIPVEGVIDTLLSSFLSRQIDRAVSEGADMIIFEVDSPGGLKFESQQLADQIADLSERGIRTVAWVPRQAISGAAIISLGCDQIILAPDAIIGDAGAIAMNNERMFERVPEKIVSPFRVEIANLAERKGRPPAILMAMVDRNLEVFEVKHSVTGRTWFMTDEEIHKSGGEWIKGRLVPESRKEDLLLTADGERAHELKIAEPPAADFDELRSRLGLPDDVPIKEIARTWVDDFVVVMNSPFVVGLLFFLGIMCIYLELHTMTGLFGIGAVLCFVLYFWSKVLGGTAGSLEIVLFFLGFALIACEIFLIPGFGVFGVTGTLLVIASLVMAAQTFRGLDASETIAASGRTLGPLGGAIVGVIVAGSILSKYLPKIPMFSGMILAPPGSDLPNGTDVRLRPELTSGESPNGGPQIGLQGVASTTLRPTGKARLDGHMVTVTSEGPYINAGTPIEVIEISGSKILVREIS